MKRSNWLDTTLLLAAATAVLYFLHYTFLYGFYERCNVAFVDLNYSLQDVLYSSPLIALAILVFVMMGIHFGLDSKDWCKFTDLSAKAQRIMLVLVFLIVTSVVATFYNLGSGEASKFLKSKNHQVVITTQDSTIQGYSYLTRSADFFYFFKSGENVDHPQILTLRAEQIKQILSVPVESP